MQKKFSEEQCKSKLKNLKQAYFSLKKDRVKTGNKEEDEEEDDDEEKAVKPSMQLLLDYFSQTPGMTRTSLGSSDESANKENCLKPVAQTEEKSEERSPKKIKKEDENRKTCFSSGPTRTKSHGEHVESGLKLVSEGLKEGLLSIGSAMQTPQQPPQQDILHALDKQSSLLEKLFLHLISKDSTQ